MCESKPLYDWSKCFLCQLDDSDELKKPAANPTLKSEALKKCYEIQV